MSKFTLFVGFLILAAVWVFTGCVDPALEHEDDPVPLEQVERPQPEKPIAKKQAPKKRKAKKAADEELDL